MDKPIVTEMAPEAPASSFLRQNDADFAAALGLTDPSPKEEAGTPASPEADASVTPLAQPSTEPEAPTTEVEAPVTEEVPPVEAEAEAEPEPEKPKKQYEFQLADEKGELEVPEDLKITFKANGKVRENVPLEKVVQLAQMGVYNHEREQEVVQIKQEAQTRAAEVEQLRKSVEQYDTYFQRMFEDDVFAEEARAAYIAQNTPEAKARKAQAELQTYKAQVQQQQADVYVGQFIQQQILPSFERIMKENPTVDEHALLGRYSTLTAPFLVRGKFPINTLSKVQHLVENDLAYWARGIHNERTEADAAKTAEVRKAQLEAAKAKRQLTRTATPASNGNAAPTKPQPKKFNRMTSAKADFDALFPTNED